MTTEVTTASSARAGGYAKGRATREEILDAAMQLFGEVGYHTASLREVASRVGISHPGLLHHFSSKAVLLAAVLERRDEVDEVAFEADLAAGHDYFDALARLIERNAAAAGHRRAVRDALRRGHVARPPRARVLPGPVPPGRPRGP